MPTRAASKAQIPMGSVVEVARYLHLNPVRIRGLEEYPTLTRDDVLACLRYSSRLMGNHFVVEKVA